MIESLMGHIDAAFNVQNNSILKPLPYLLPSENKVSPSVHFKGFKRMLFSYFKKTIKNEKKQPFTQHHHDNDDLL